MRLELVNCNDSFLKAYFQNLIRKTGKYLHVVEINVRRSVETEKFSYTRHFILTYCYYSTTG